MTALQLLTLPRTTAIASALDYLREQIIASHLPEAWVGELLGVSRAPVREALTWPGREGLIAFDRRGTARVCVHGHADIRELGLMW